MQNTLYILGGIGFILFFVGLGMSYRNWRIHTLLLMPAVFIMAVVFLCLLVQTLKVHQVWGQKLDHFEKELAKAKAHNKFLEEGGIDEKDGKVKDGINQYRQRLIDFTRDRGHIWNGCEPAQADPTTGEVKVTVAAPKEHQIKAKMVLYVFDERDLSVGGGYLGSFRVASVFGGEMPMEEPMGEAKAEEKAEEKADADKAKDEKPKDEKADADKDKKDDKAKEEKKEEKPAAEPKPPATAPDGSPLPSVVTLVPTWPATPAELARIKDSPGPWSLFNKLPIDDHGSLVNIHLDPISGAVFSDNEGKPLVRDAELKRLFPASVADEYVKDEQDAIWNNPPQGGDDPLELQLVKVEFLQDYTLPAAPAPVAPAPLGAGGAPAGGPAGGAGGGVPGGGGAAGGGVPAGGVAPAGGGAPPVAVGGAGGAGAGGAVPQAPAEPIVFIKHTQVMLPVLVAQDLESRKIVKIVNPKRIYQRELRDYVKIFDSYYLDRKELSTEAENIARQNASQDEVQQENAKLVEGLQSDQAKLAHDLKGFKFEAQALANHMAALKRQQQALIAKYRELFLANQQLASQIDQLQRKAAAAIDRRAPAPQANIIAPQAAQAVK